MENIKQQTIAAIATPPGRGGIGIIRVSGTQVLPIAQALLRKIPTPRYAQYGPFLTDDGQAIDEGIALFFPAPYSFTGEDVLELQGHGGAVILDILLQRILSLGARQADSGEFSERAFLNGKLDLVQAEAIADLIDAGSQQAARSALRSLQGEFSQTITQLVAQITELRMYVEAAIDFSTEEIDFLSEGQVLEKLQNIRELLISVENAAQQGALLRDGMTVVIAGRPNAGKSSLLNCLSGQDMAIVTEIPGTTRDILRTHIQIDGLPLHILDTAGLRDSDDPIEKEGIMRAQQEMLQADYILLVVDPTQNQKMEINTLCKELKLPIIPEPKKLTLISNKIDLTQTLSTIDHTPEGFWHVRISAKYGDGIKLLRTHLKNILGYHATPEGTFSARRRHLTALNQAKSHLQRALDQLAIQAGELMAEELRLAQQALAEITGDFLPDDLLGKIFSSFCVGK